MRHLKIGGVAALALIAAVGCADLDVTNPNAPDRRRALAQPSDVEGLIAGSFRTFFYGTHTFHGAALALSGMAEEMSSSWGNFAWLDTQTEPRQKLNNSPSYAYSYFIEEPWYDSYAAIRAATDGLIAIRQDGIKIVDEGTGEDNTKRAEAFALFVSGIAHGFLAQLYDQAFIVDEATVVEDLELQPFDAVLDHAIALLDEAISIASQQAFTLPSSWINEFPLSNTELIRVAKSYKARYLAAVARNPAERGAVDWNAVLTLTQEGIQEDFGPMGDGFENWDAWVEWASTEPIWGRYDLYSLGQADVSGNWEQWMATPVAERTPFIITSPDRRVMGAAGPKSNGKYVTYYSRIWHNPTRGTYFLSNYGGEARWPWVLSSGVGHIVILPKTEMDMLAAEAHLRLGNNQAAADLINITRVANGELPPVTAAGVPGTPADCVPQKPDGTCGTLFDAMAYEKFIETWMQRDGGMWSDKRGWGTLVSGTATQLPVPGIELQILQAPIYTFGGVAGESAAPYRAPVAAPADYFTGMLERAAQSRSGSAPRQAN